MKLALCVFVAGPAVSAMATVIDFEDLVGQAPMVDGYGGVSDWTTGQWWHYDFDQPPYTPKSGVQRVYSLDASNEFSFAQDVVLSGAWFSGYGTPDGFGPISWNLYYQGNLVHVSGLLDCTSVPTFLPTGYNGPVDRVSVSGTTDFFVMDDLTYDVPTPGAAGLLGMGALAAARRRR